MGCEPTGTMTASDPLVGANNAPAQNQVFNERGEPLLADAGNDPAIILSAARANDPGLRESGYPEYLPGIKIIGDDTSQPSMAARDVVEDKASGPLIVPENDIAVRLDETELMAEVLAADPLGLELNQSLTYAATTIEQFNQRQWMMDAALLYQYDYSDVPLLPEQQTRIQGVLDARQAYRESDQPGFYDRVNGYLRDSEILPSYAWGSGSDWVENTLIGINNLANVPVNLVGTAFQALADITGYVESEWKIPMSYIPGAGELAILAGPAKTAGMMRSIPNRISLDGAASKFGNYERGKIPHQTEALFTQNSNGPRSLEDMINFIDDRGSFNGNLVDYELISDSKLLVDHGGGLRVIYNAVPDATFNKYIGDGWARYNKELRFYENERIDWNRMFSDTPVVNVRQSLLNSDRGSTVIFHHEYLEIQGLYNKLNNYSMRPPEIRSLIDNLHVDSVTSGDRLLGRMIISEGL